MKDIVPGMFDKIPDYMLIRDANSLEKSGDLFGLVNSINAELDRRRPEPVRYDENWLGVDRASSKNYTAHYLGSKPSITINNGYTSRMLPIRQESNKTGETTANGILPRIYSKMPDFLLIREAVEEFDPFRLVNLINAELDRRRPDVKSEVIGYDDNGREIWLEC